MTISHLKHSYLNWRANLCRGFFFWIWLSWFSFGLNRIIQVHDMTINFFLFSFVLMIRLLRATTHAIDDLPSRSISSHVKIVLKGWPFDPKVFISFLSTKRVMAQKCSREMDVFLSACPKASIRVISEYHDFRDLCFWSLKGFWQAWSYSKSWCIPNYQLSVSFKNSSFFVAWFSKNSRNKFLNQEFYGQLPKQAWSKCLFDFSKSCPSGHQGFQKIPKKERIYQDGLTTNNDHQSFWNPHCSKLGNIFIFFALTLWSQNLFPFFKNIKKIQNDKDVWNTSSFISCKCWH